MWLKDKMEEVVQDDCLAKINDNVITFLIITPLQMIIYLQDPGIALDLINSNAFIAERDAPWANSEQIMTYFDQITWAIKQIHRHDILLEPVLWKTLKCYMTLANAMQHHMNGSKRQMLIRHRKSHIFLHGGICQGKKMTNLFWRRLVSVVHNDGCDKNRILSVDDWTCSANDGCPHQTTVDIDHECKHNHGFFQGNDEITITES